MKDERGFKEVIHNIKGAEKDKEKFLKASRLDRHDFILYRNEIVCFTI